MLNSVLDYFFPNNCMGCGNRLHQKESMLCSICIQRLPKTNYHLYHDNPVMKSLWGKVQCKSASSIYSFHTKSSLQRVIHELKYNNNTIIGQELGKLTALETQNDLKFKKLECIVPVPLHPSKKALRGYNQCDFIAEGMAEVFNTVVNTNLLNRVRNNPSQTAKNKYQRWENSKHLFELNDELPKGEWLLIDDMFTTGSTIISCLNAIPAKYHEQINVLTVGYAP